MGLDTSRVLRVGVVWRGQVVAERVLDRRIDVTVGTRPDATVSVNPKEYPDFPALIPLAVMHQGVYYVLLPSDPAHAISLRGGPAGSQGVDKNSVVAIKGGQKGLPIEAYTGGSLTVGDAILMFQFVRGDSVPTVTKEETVLRIGLVHEDRLLSDQVFHGDRAVTIGVGAKSTIALPDVEYKGGDAIFRAQKNSTSFKVHLPKGSDFRLALEGQPVVTLQEALQKKLAVLASDGGVEFQLPLKARGRATLGPYTLLFQVVRQSITVPAVPRKSLLAQVAGPLISDSTWSLSFLIAIVLVGSIVGQALLFRSTTGRFLAKQQGEEELTHTTFEVEVMEKEEEKKEEEKPTVDVRTDEVKKIAEEKEKKDEKRKAEPKAAKPESTGKTVDPEEAKRNARAAVQKTTIAGAFGAGATTKLFAVGEGDDGTVVAKTFGGTGGDGSEGAGGPGSGLKLAASGGGGGTIEKVKGGAKGFGDRTADSTKVEAKKEEAIVKIKLSSGGVEGGEGESRGEVGKVISRKNSAVQQCYERALRDNPEEGGKVKVSFTVGTAGTVTDVSVSGASGGFSDCIKNKFMAIRGLPILASPQSFNQSYVFTQGSGKG